MPKKFMKKVGKDTTKAMSGAGKGVSDFVDMLVPPVDKLKMKKRK